LEFATFSLTVFQPPPPATSMPVPETARRIANHESPRTTKLYDRCQDEISLDEVERILI
jgi:hypothetical protein